MGIFTIPPKNIDARYRIPFTGEYNVAVYICPHCHCNVINEMYTHMCGFADSSVGLVKITECPKCFTKFYSHAIEEDYECFLDSVEDGENIFYPPVKNGK